MNYNLHPHTMSSMLNVNNLPALHKYSLEAMLSTNTNEKSVQEAIQILSCIKYINMESECQLSST